MIRILTVYHFEPKPEEKVENRIYRPLVLPMKDPRFAHDPVMAENSFAEMRAHHWAHLTWEGGTTHYGFQHYRRWFYPELFGRSRLGFNIVPRSTFDAILARRRAMTEAEQEALSAWVGQFDILTVVPPAGDLGAHFIACHGLEPWRALMSALDAIKWDGPRDARVFYPANMFIIRREPFARYMTFWREVMDRLALTIKPERGSYAERIFGFLSERLWTLWLVHERQSRQFPLKEVPVVLCDQWKV